MTDNKTDQPKITTRLSDADVQRFAKMARDNAYNSVGYDGWRLLVRPMRDALVMSHILQIGLGWARSEENTVSCLQQIVEACNIE